MHLATRNGGQCAFCAFRSSEWLVPLVRRHNGVRPYSNPRIVRLLTSTGNVMSQIENRDLPPAPIYPPRHERTNPNTFRSKNPRRSPPGGRAAAKVSPPHSTVDALEMRSGVRRLLKREQTTIGVFGRLLAEQVVLLENKLFSKDLSQTKSWGINSDEELGEKLEEFRQKIIKSCKEADKGVVSKTKNPLFFRLRHAFVTGNISSLAPEMKYAFINSVVDAGFNSQERINQEKLADLRNPLDWFPATRAMQRTIHLHVGPTNSGKTYHALKRLEKAESGIYAGPLRLLAHEVYTRFNAMGKACALITGEERRIPEGLTHVMNSCTVEMVPLNSKVDVAVIDEIQMMGDMDRGWAWTQAFLGVQAKEVHLCGELRTIDLVTKLCRAMGDELVIHKYERLSPLKSMDKSLRGDLRNLRKGDAIILFSRVAIHAMKADIEKATQKRCAVVYGSLPPETRAQQAALFNDPDNDYDFLVASDAVGMGLNLSIKRIIFEATSKHDGTNHRLIATSEIKQIAGRAGRYKTASDAVKQGASQERLQLDAVKKVKPNVGLVTTLENFDLPIVREAMRTEVESLKTAGIFPPSNILLQFASYFPKKTPFSYIVLRLHELSSLSSTFHMCMLKEQIDVADLIQPYDLSPIDRVIFMNAPVAVRDAGFPTIVKELAACVANQSGGELLDLKSLDLELLELEIGEHPTGSKGYLREAETLHKAITLYLWLSYRFAGVFVNQALAFHVKGLVETKIDECLLEVSWDAGERKQRTIYRQWALKKQFKEMENLAAEGAAIGASVHEAGSEEDMDPQSSDLEVLDHGIGAEQTLDAQITEAGMKALDETLH